MSVLAGSREALRPLAEEVLGMFESVEDAARKQAGTDGLSVSGVMPANTFTSPALLGTLQQMASDRMRAAQVLMREPAIARVEARTADGQLRAYYFCRVMPPTVPGALLVSYRAPAGRMAALDVGEDFVLPNGETLQICSKVQLRPEKVDFWDSHGSRYIGDAGGPYTIESLRALLKAVPEAEVADLLSAILAAEGESAAVVEGLRRTVLTKMGLRDQPVLDRFQDGIFRLPIGSRVLLLGPPGTGKTTTLIRRLGQKLESDQLDEAERAQVARMEEDGVGPLAQGWIMFTPTRLLQQYVKEAFAREGVPASEQQIRTWSDHRRLLSRDVLRILRSPAGGGTFVLKEDAAILHASALSDPLAWYAEFDEWQKALFIAAFSKAAEDLAKSTDAALAKLAVGPREILARARPERLDEAIVALARESQAIRDRVAELKQQTDTQLRQALNLQLNRNGDFLAQLAAYLDSLQDTSGADDEDVDEGEEGDDGDADEDELRAEQKTRLGVAAQAYIKALRAHARARARRRQLRKGSRNARIVEWIGDRGLAEAAIANVGASLLMQSAARRLSSPVARYVMGVPARYRAFRKEKQASGGWYLDAGFAARDMNPAELDAVALAMLRSVASLLGRPGVRRTIDEPTWSSVRSIRDQMRIQVLVDEATDFSALQLGCMAALAHPETRSFFACGDFNQRLTTWGVRTQEEFDWACAGIAAQRITITYRQSAQLNQFARGLVEIFGGDATAVQLPPGVDCTGVPPVLVEGLEKAESTARWLADRIVEIARFVKQLPSIAVLVMNETDVEPMADALRAALTESNVSVEACKDGQAVGTGEVVRVFDVKHIKGLEFEAVFFVGVDHLAQAEPELFDKYLYVGSTRAATYLGLACFGTLPPALAQLRPQFVGSWSQ